MNIIYYAYHLLYILQMIKINCIKNTKKYIKKKNLRECFFEEKKIVYGDVFFLVFYWNFSLTYHAYSAMPKLPYLRK